MEKRNGNIYKGTSDFPIGIFSHNVFFPDSHHHIEYEIFYVTLGECIFAIEENEYHIKKGDIIFVEPGVNHYTKPVSTDSEFHYYALSFDASVLGLENDTCRQIFDKMCVKRFLSIPKEYIQKFENVINEQKKGAFGHQLKIKALLFELLTYILETHQYVEISPEIKIRKNTTSNSVIQTALLYIREHYRENISLEDLLELTSYSKSHFIRLFKTATGMNYTDYVNKYRIEKSCLDLIYSDKNITQIATENGFNNIQYFSKIFKLYMKCTPKQYQKKGHNIIVPSTVSEANRQS